MLWIVQDNLYNERGYVRFIEALDALAPYGVQYLTVKPVPFTNKILPADFDSTTQDFETTPEPEIDTNQKIIICGATSLSRISKAKGWYPGTYLNDNFDFSVWRNGFGVENVLNGDAVVGKIKDLTVPKFGDSFFVRPVHDTKSFSGTVMSFDELNSWLNQMGTFEEEEFTPLHMNTEIMISSVKKIYSEYRMFVVDGKVVTGSLYKRGDVVVQDENVDPDVYTLAQKMVDHWQPAKAFVIDIAITPTGMKVIEINNINSAGFYAADVQKIIMAIEDMER